MYVEKRYGALKIPKMACSKLVNIFLLNLSIKRYSFFYVAKSISFEVHFRYKHFSGQIYNFIPLLQILTQTLEILKLDRNNYYLATEIEKRTKKYVSFFNRVTFFKQAIFPIKPHNFFST